MKKKLSLIATMLLSLVINAQTITDNLITYYPFNNGSMNDDSGNNNTATNVNTPSSVINNTNDVMSFSQGQHIKLPESILLKSTISISLWFKTTSSGVIIGHQNKAVGGSPNIFVPILYVGTDGQLKANFWSGIKRNVNTSVDLVNDNFWHHVVITTSNNGQKIYVDNVETGSTTHLHDVLAEMIFNQLGTGYSETWPSGNTESHHFVGSIDNVRIYDTAIESAVVDAIYHTEKNDFPNIDPSLVAAYYFDNGSMADSSIYSTDAINRGSTATTDRHGVTNSAISLDGISYVNLPDNLLLTAEQSISLWFKTNQEGAILGYQDKEVSASTPDLHVPIATITPSGTLNANFWSGNQANINTSTSSYADNQWHHLVLTVDDNSQKIFIDNQLEGTYNRGHVILSAMKFNQLGTAYVNGTWINSANAGYYSFNGSLDDVLIYNRAISAVEVDALFKVQSSVLSVQDEYSKEVFNVFPNPVQNILIIQLDEFIQAEVYSLFGTKVISSTSKELDTSKLQSGIYLLKLTTTDNKIITKKIIKE